MEGDLQQLRQKFEDLQRDFQTQRANHERRQAEMEELLQQSRETVRAKDAQHLETVQEHQRETAELRKMNETQRSGAAEMRASGGPQRADQQVTPMEHLDRGEETNRHGNIMPTISHSPSFLSLCLSLSLTCHL